MGNGHHLVRAIVLQHTRSTCTYVRMCIEPNRRDPRSKWHTHFDFPIIQTKTKKEIIIHC